MKYRVNYLDKPSDEAIIIEAANPQTAAQLFFSQNPRNERCSIRVWDVAQHSVQDFPAVQFMDESTRAKLPVVPLQSLVTGAPWSDAPRQEEIRVVVTDIDMHFQSMVFFMVKWAFATIPAIIIICVIAIIVLAVLRAAFGS
jgi:hypothetical protein